MDMSGIVLIRDKYDDLRSVSDNLFMAARDGKAHLVDVKDNPVGNVEFRRWFLGKRKLLVEEEENSWCFIDYAGQKTGDKSFYNMESNAYLSVESDYVDLMGLLHSLDIKDDGIGGYTLGMTAKECVEKTDEEVGYDGETYITTRLDLKTCKADVTVAFPEAIHQIKKWKDGYRYHTAFLLTEPRPDYVRLVIRNEKKLNDKGDMLFETMKSYMKAFGKRLIREDKDVQVYDQGGGIAMTVLKNRKEDGVLVIYIGAADRSFDRVDEEAPSYMEDSVVVVEEVIEVDSVIADSAVAW